ncbi:MAG TPA: SOS response-associated peptidase [Opitutaceae bacterium]
MCSRYLLAQEHLRAILTRLGIPSPGTLPSTRYNLPPGGVIPAVRPRTARSHTGLGEDRRAGRELAALHWGLVPSWARDDDSPIINARAESLAEKPSFRDAFRRRRCLIPASGFYEWKAIGSARQPWLFRRPDGAPFGFAGLWETWNTPDGSVRESCAVITTAPNALMAPIHHRMPVILAEKQWAAWLDPDYTEPAQLAPLLAPWAAEAMTATAVTRRVNHVDFDEPACLTPPTPDEAPRTEDQLGLGF